MTKIIQRMFADGMVESASSAEDRRVTIVSITPKGEEAGLAAWHEATRIADRLFADFTDVEKQLLSALLKKLADALDRY